MSTRDDEAEGVEMLSPNVVEPSSLICERPILEESRGLYSLISTAPATSGVGRCSLTKVKPLVLSGAHTGIIPEPGSRDNSRATADGQAEHKTP